ncbi:MAG: flagellin [Anaerolineales bacterium]|nr:flagellin [Anaerolineales bacterium]
MAGVDITRIAGNIQALQSLNSLQAINAKLATHQARLSTGKQILEAADDPAGMSIATTFDVRRQSMSTVINKIGDAKNLLSTAEGGLQKIKDILVKMHNKALEAKGDTIGSTERSAIEDQLKAFAAEIDDVMTQTKWNDTDLIGKSGSAGGASDSLSFLVSADGDTYDFSLSSGFGRVDMDLEDADLSLADDTAIGTTLTNVQGAIDTVKDGIADVGAVSARLTFKEEALTVAYTNTEAAYNRIMNANMAKEQVEASKLQILQQTSTAMLAQANVAPQFLLTLFQ